MDRYNIVEHLNELSNSELDHIISAAEIELRERHLTIEDPEMSDYYEQAEKVFAFSTEI